MGLQSFGLPAAARLKEQVGWEVSVERQVKQRNVCLCVHGSAAHTLDSDKIYHPLVQCRVTTSLRKLSHAGNFCQAVR